MKIRFFIISNKNIERYTLLYMISSVPDCNFLKTKSNIVFVNNDKQKNINGISISKNPIITSWEKDNFGMVPVGKNGNRLYFEQEVEETKDFLSIQIIKEDGDGFENFVYSG